MEILDECQGFFWRYEDDRGEKYSGSKGQISHMTAEIKPSLRKKVIPKLIRPIFRCNICNKTATCYLVTDGGKFVVLCEPCFQTCNVFYKREIRRVAEQGSILHDELDNQSIE